METCFRTSWERLNFLWSSSDFAAYTSSSNMNSNCSILVLFEKKKNMSLVHVGRGTVCTFTILFPLFFPSSLFCILIRLCLSLIKLMRFNNRLKCILNLNQCLELPLDFNIIKQAVPDLNNVCVFVKKNPIVRIQ